MTGAASPAALVARARRMGSVPYSELPPLGPWLEAPALASWEVDFVDEWWHRLRRPDPYAVVEVGAGDGGRGRELLAAGPECLAALRLVLVEPEARQSHERLLAVDLPAFLYPLGTVDPAEPDVEPMPATRVGPLITSLSELPVLEGPAVLLVVGWLSRLPADRFEWRQGRWWEVRLTASDDGRLMDTAVSWDGPAPAPSPPGPDGTRVLRPDAAGQWLAQAFRSAPAGVVAVVDRWGPGDVALDLDRLSTGRPPLDEAPVPLFDGLSVVTWRLG